MHVKLLLLLAFLSFSAMLKAQDSTAVVVKKEHSVQKATLYSTFVPGLGQIYNRKYWKVPLIYGGGFLLVQAAIKNGLLYQEYLDAYRAKTDNNASTVDNYPKLSAENLILIKDNYKRNRDISIIGTVVIYGLNILDAYVDASLFDFNVNDDLKASIMPMNQYTAQGELVPSVALTIRFK